MKHGGRAAGAFSDLLTWIPGGTANGDSQLLGDLVADLAAKSLNLDIFEALTDDGPPCCKGRAKMAKLHALAATWRAQRRRLTLAAIVDVEGTPQHDPKQAAQLLEEFWSPIFQEKKIDPEEAIKVMKFVPKCPPGIV